MIIESGMIISFAAWLGAKIADKGFDAIYEKLQDRSKYDEAFTACIKSVSTRLEEKYSDILGNSISYFFTKPEVFDELGKLLFLDQKVNNDTIALSFDESTLPAGFILEFITELKKELNTNPLFQEILANKEIYITIQGISKDIETISLNSTLSIKVIEEIKNILIRRFKDQFNVDNFLSVYYKNLVTSFKIVNFIGLGIDPSIKKGKRKELNDIFVKPDFLLLSKHHIEREAEIKKASENIFINNNKTVLFNNLFNRNYNYVILGNAGAGKSLLTKLIILYIVEKAEVFENEAISSCIPFRIELKSYLAFKKNNKGGLLKYISLSLENEFQIPNVVEKNISKMLTERKSILFFDGLDEIFDVSDKLSVKNDIETFHNAFPKIKSITTSRFTGYNDAKLDDREFCELSIKPFSNDQIDEYVTKWYELEEDDFDIRNNEIVDFIQKKDKIDIELLSNPLLLSLIVILYRNNLKIPESKLEIYQSCTNTLVDKWDAIKQLEINLDTTILQKKEVVLSDLAFWQYKALSSDKPEITFHKAKQAVIDSLIRKGLADDDNSEVLAKSFLDYAQKRSIYFDNNFTHKTFLEYYTAYWIYSNIEKKHKIEERNSIIANYISKPFWFIVLELLFNMIDKDQPDNDILDDIISQFYSDNKSLPFLLYVIPNLSNISEKIQLQLYDNAIRYLISIKEQNDNQKKDCQDLYQRISLNIIGKGQKEVIEKVVNNFSEKEGNLMFFTLIMELRRFGRNLDVSKVIESNHYKEIMKTDAYLYHITLLYESSNGMNDDKFMNYIKEYIELFGKKTFLRKGWQAYYDHVYFWGLFEVFLNRMLQKSDVAFLLESFNELNQLSVSNLDIIEWLLLNNHPFFHMTTEEMFYQLLKNIEQFNETETVLCYLLLRNIGRTLSFETSIDDLDDVSINSRRVLKKIISLKKPKEILDFLISELKISNKDILNIKLDS